MKVLSLKRSLIFAAGLIAVFLGISLLVQGVSYLTWHLSGAGDISFEELENIPVPERNPTEPKALHSVREWSPEDGKVFHEAPMLRPLVEAGELPPVADRLPEDPLVIVPPEQIGPYGGTWKCLGTGPRDIEFYLPRHTYEGLVRWDPMGQKIFPNLAVRWKIEDGGRIYTFWLRKGVRWSDGHPFTVDDILFWYEDVLKDPDLTPVIPREFRPGGELLQVEKVDQYTVRFRFQKPYGLFLQMLASKQGDETSRLTTFPAHYLKQFHPRYVPKEKLETMARAKGFDLWSRFFLDDRYDWRNVEIPRIWAWIVTKPLPARPVVLERNPYYWKVDPEGNQLPYIDRMNFGVYDRETINLKAINGEIGMQKRHLNLDIYPLLMSNRKKGGYRIFHWISAAGGAIYLSPNLNHLDPVLKKILNDRRFRIALSHAINRQELNEAAYFGIGKPRQAAPPRHSLYYSPEYERAHIEYDTELANKLLDEMGLTRRNKKGIRLRPDGKPLRLNIESVVQSGYERILQLVADHWTAVGVESKVKMMEPNLFYQRKDALMHDIGISGSGVDQIPVVDPRWFFPANRGSIQGIAYARWYLSDGARGETPPPDIQKCMELYGQIEQTPDQQEQIRIFKEIIELNRKNLWVIGTIGEVPILVLVKNNFRNVPEVAVAGWVVRDLGNTAPECYSIEEK